MTKTPAKRSREEEDAIGALVLEFEKRYLEFSRLRRANMREEGHDLLTIVFTEYVWFGNRSAYEELLVAMMDEAERQRLRSDPIFTEAWRMFMKARWRRKRIEQRTLITTIALLVAVVGIGAVWSAFELFKSVISGGK